MEHTFPITGSDGSVTYYPSSKVLTARVFSNRERAIIRVEGIDNDISTVVASEIALISNYFNQSEKWFEYGDKAVIRFDMIASVVIKSKTDIVINDVGGSQINLTDKPATEFIGIYKYWLKHNL